MRNFLKKFVFVIILFLLLFFFDSKNKSCAANLYYIKVNYGSNVVTIYENGTNIPIKAMVCSCGTATPKSGTYSLDYKYRWLALMGGVHGQYCTRIVGNILFHSVPYLQSGNPGSLEYWEYDKLGTTASAGCIRLTVEDAKWIYENCSSGTKVEFYSDSSNPGPLGKPEAKKISNSPNRDWDPTDSDTRNPWKNTSIISTNILFDYKYYADNNEDLKSIFGYDETNLKSHFIAFGMNEGRKASPIFDVKYYLNNNLDLKQAFGNNYSLAYEHYISCGMNENREASSIFSLRFYKNFYSDLNNMSNEEAISHYIQFGINEGRLGRIPKELESIMFDYKYYADNNPDVKAAFGYRESSLKQHWYMFGIKEGRASSEVFNLKEYIKYNPDLQKVFNGSRSKCLKHFVDFGYKEGRRTSENFYAKAYRRRYVDLNNAFGDNYILYFSHYINSGKSEKRVAV